MNRIDLDGRRAVVTGGGQGIGRAIAARLLASGAAVSLWDRDRPLIEATRDELASQGTVHACAVDVTDLAAVEAAVADTNQALGGIEILVNNAGIAGPNHNLWEYPPEAWREVIDIDLNSVFYCCRAVVPQMIAQNYGRICSTASIAGKEGNPTASPYAAAKAGVIALTKALGKELAKHDIAVNCITPAACKTRIFDQIDALVLRGVQAIQDEDLVTLGELMNVCHGMLNALQVSTPELEQLVDIARENGALGAKLTGGGGGGSIIALCDGDSSSVINAIRAAGYQAIRVDLGADINGA